MSHPVLRRLLPGFAVSYLGDGMSAIAVSWLAIQLAPTGRSGTWVALAVAAYTLPGACGALLFGRFLRGRNGAQMTGWDATLRASALAAIPVAHALGVLSIGLYVVLLAISSLLHTWGSAGRFTLIAEVLPRRHRLAANALVSTLAEFSALLGPVLAGVLIDWGGAATVIGIDAATFAVLAISCRYVQQGARIRAGPSDEAPSRTGGFRVIRQDPTLFGLVALTFGFFFLYGPVQVALPIYLAVDRAGSATLLGIVWTAFGIGAVAGGLAAGYLRRLPLWPTTVGIVVGWGAALLPVGLGATPMITVAAFGVGGLIYGPYLATSMVLFQRSTTPSLLSQVLAARGAVLLLSAPVGAILGGPLVAALGARATLLVSALATLGLGLLAACAVGLGYRRRRSGRLNEKLTQAGNRRDQLEREEHDGPGEGGVGVGNRGP